VWLLYSVMVLKWQFHDDFRTLLRGNLGPHRIPRPRGAALGLAHRLQARVSSRLPSFSLALHGFWTVAAPYLLFAVAARSVAERRVSSSRTA
jgi:hypothetical protein